MKKRIGITLSAIIFIFLGFGSICSAATIFTDNFNSYSTGNISGKSDWTGSSGFTTIQESVVFEGTKAFKISNPFPGTFNIQKSGILTNDGRMTVYVQGHIGGSTRPNFEIQLKEGNIVRLSVKAHTDFGFSYYNADIGGYSSFGPSMASDTWYAVQIEWRSQDHKARYRINSESFSDWHEGLTSWLSGLDTVNISLADGVGFIDTIQENFFTNKTPVLIVPGVTGTELRKGEELLWADIPRMAKDITDNFMDPLSFSENSISSDSEVSISNVISSKNFSGVTIFDYIESLTGEFKSQGYVENENLFTFPYDWRYGVSGQLEDGKTVPDLLSQKIQDIIQQTGSDKVDVVAHSLGGLIVKKYIIDYSADHHIGKAVFIGVPNTGAPKAIKMLLEGDSLGMFFLSQSEMKKIAENLPVSYDLLPTQQYYNAKGSFVETIDYGNIFDLSSTFPEVKIKDLNYQEFKNYLTSDHKLNIGALTGAETLHNQNFDDFDIRTAGVDVYAINGCKAGTINKITETTSTNIFGQKLTNYKALKMGRGDDTVPLESATNLPIDQDKKYYALAASHSKMLSQDGIRQQIVNILSGGNLVVKDSLVTQDIDKCNLNGKAISIFSPIDISVQDQYGNRLGLSEDGSIFNEIPNASFDILGEHKFVYLPEDNGQIYTINIKGTDTGTFTIKIQDIFDNQVGKTEAFINMLVTKDLTGQINLGDAGASPSLIMRQSLEDVPVTFLPSAIISPTESEDVMLPVSEAVITGTAGQANIYRSDVVVDIKALDQVMVGKENQSSGVLSITYAMDDLAEQKVSANAASFTVSNEGNHTITFFSTDKAGNNEPKKVIYFTIDKTAPEVIIAFNQNIKDLSFSGTDNISDSSSLVIVKQDDVVKITDQAGNITKVTFLRESNKIETVVQIKSIHYNRVLSDANKNHMIFSWSYGRDGKLDKLSQDIKSGSYHILAVYDDGRTKISGMDSLGKILKTFNGLKIVNISTQQGNLTWSY